MEKRIVSVDVPFNFGWVYGVTLQEIKNDIQEMEKLGVNYIDIFEDYGSIVCKAQIERLETDEEFKDRINKESVNRALVKERELKMLQELKAKYGDL
jgi:hypothetical protein